MTEKQIAARKRLKQMFSSFINIKEIKKEYRNRKAREYRAENKEHYRILHRNWYRKNKGTIPLDAPVMTPSECTKIAREVKKQKKEAK
jgi:hypothetical protein